MLSAASLLLVMMALSVVMLLVLSSLARSGAQGIREWLVANALAVVGLPLIAARGIVPDVLSIEVANTMLMGTSAMMVAGFRRHLGRRVSWRALGAWVALGLAAIVILHHGSDSFSLRVVAVSLVHAVLALWGGLSVKRCLHAAPHRYPWLFTIGACFAVAAGMAVRALTYALQAAGWMPPVDGPTLNLLFFSVGTLSLPALTLGAVMMANAGIIARATWAADHDHLTGAPSRRAFFALAERERARSSRHGAPLSLLLFDVDHFKRINDTHGHAAGDRVLVEIVDRVTLGLRGADACGRLGGEEFAVLLPDTPAGGALPIAERLRLTLQGAPRDGTGIGYTVSIGVASLLPGETIAAMLSRADAALYEAKAAGRNKVMVAPAARVAKEKRQA